MVRVVNYTAILLIFRPHRSARVNLDAVRLQRAVLGPLTKAEIWSAAVLIALIVGSMTRDLHGIAPAGWRWGPSSASSW